MAWHCMARGLLHRHHSKRSTQPLPHPRSPWNRPCATALDRARLHENIAGRPFRQACCGMSLRTLSLSWTSRDTRTLRSGAPAGAAQSTTTLGPIPLAWGVPPTPQGQRRVTPLALPLRVDPLGVDRAPLAVALRLARSQLRLPQLWCLQLRLSRQDRASPRRSQTLAPPRRS